MATERGPGSPPAPAAVDRLDVLRKRLTALIAARKEYEYYRARGRVRTAARKLGRYRDLAAAALREARRALETDEEDGSW